MAPIESPRPQPTRTAVPVIIESPQPGPAMPTAVQTDLPAQPDMAPRPIIIADPGLVRADPDRSDAPIVIPEVFEERSSEISSETVIGTAPEPPPPAPVSSGPTQAEIDAAVSAASTRAAQSITDDSISSAVEIGQVKISPIMFACLEADPSFSIKPKECQTKNTIEDPDPVWTWEVTPNEPGEDYEMKLRSGIVVQADDQSLRRIGQPSRIAQIDVEVTALGWVERFFRELTKWINSPLEALGALAALIAAIAGVRTAWRKLRGKKDVDESEATPPDANGTAESGGADPALPEDESG